MKGIYLYLLLFSLLPASFNVLAQTPFLKPHLLFRGKEKYDVNVINQGPKGLIWFGTDRGLFRFDGINYKQFTTAEGLAEDQISALCFNKNEKLWVGHNNGEITIYDGQKFQVFTPEEGLGKARITDIAIDSLGTIWFSTQGEGVYKYDGRHLSNLNMDDGLSDNNVYNIEIDNKNTLWFATDNGITQYSSGNCQVISMKDGLPDNIVRVLQVSKDGKLWIGTEEKGIILYDTLQKIFTSFEGWKFGAITGFTMSLENDIWISTSGDGIIQLSLTGDGNSTYRSLALNQGLISNRLSTIIKDQEDNIWIGGKQGIIQVLPPVFEFLNSTNGTPFEIISSLTKDTYENIWVCSESGLYRGIPDNSGQYTWSNLSEKMDLHKVNFISLFVDSDGQIWTGTYGDGVFRINPKNLNYIKLTVKQGLCDNNVSSISGHGRLVWFSTFGGGVSCYNIKESKLSNYNDPDLMKSYVYSTISDDLGRTWIAGTLGYPSYIYEDSLYRIKTGSLPLPQLFGVTMDTSKSIWLNAGSKGIIKVLQDSLIIFDEQDGLILENEQTITFDKFNNLLIISKHGLQFFNPESGQILEFGDNSGLAYRSPILNSVFTDQKGQIWIGTETGIIKYNPEYLQFIDQKPRVFLSSKNLFYNPINSGESKFRYSENNFTFGYTGIWFRNPEGLKYRYMLDGHDLKWNYSNRNQDLTYSQLPAGTYSFKVEVSLDEKNWYNSEDSMYSFRVYPPFWKRWWFISIMIILALLGIYLYVKLRLANLQKAKEELEEEVFKRTVEIRNQNEELETQKEEIAAQLDHTEAQRDQIEAQKEEIQASIRYAHRIQSAVLPPQTQLDAILKDYFILNKPRDIVSGDFYWVAQNDSQIIFSVGDCTGHGVPGSFMSMLGLSALNDIVKSVQPLRAATILNLLRDRIRESLHQGGKSETIANDGMDISLCIFD